MERFSSPVDMRDQWAWQKFAVTFAFPVVFTRGLFDPANPVLADALRLHGATGPAQCLVVIDAGVAAARPGLADAAAAYAAARPDAMTLAAAPLVVAGGEAVKIDPAHLARIRAAILDARIDRHAHVIAVGGGALLDAAGFAAATAHRGVRHIRVPTTTLAQNDSGVGVKNAVNFGGAKNYLGTFAPPWAVLNDADFLATLPPAERIAGAAEAVKVALIRDGDFFRWLESAADALAAFEPAAEERMIRRCAELHMRQIGQGGDPFEAGSARPLDFGHWAAHKLEALTGYALGHGAAVAIGLALDARYSALAGMIAKADADRVAALLERLGFRLWHDALLRPGAGGGLALIDGLEEFREHLGGALTITLLSEIGVGVEVGRMDPALIAASLDWLAARARA